MKNTCKRVVLLFLCFLMLVTMLPVNVFAANNYRLSDAGAKMIQNFEGFAKYPAWDYAQYSVGYGSRCPDEDYDRYMANGITHEEADALFRQHIKKHENMVNKFANENNLVLTQNQFDALVSFSYNVGAGWMNHPEYRITDAVLNGADDNEFIFAMVQWCNAGGKILSGLVRRRLAEANVYLNGEYTNNIPDAYRYVIYSHTQCVENGEVDSIKIQGYDASISTVPYSTGYKEDYRFLGWYLDNDGMVCVDVLDDNLENGQKLYAKWQKGEGNIVSNSIIAGIPSNYVRVANVNTPIYKNPTIWSSVIGTVVEGQKVTIVSEYVNQAGIKWGRISNGGWVSLNNFLQETMLYPSVMDRSIEGIEETEIKESTIQVVGFLVGADVNIYEVVNVNNQTWGNTDLGWLCLDHIDCVLF